MWNRHAKWRITLVVAGAALAVFGSTLPFWCRKCPVQKPPSKPPPPPRQVPEWLTGAHSHTGRVIITLTLTPFLFLTALATSNALDQFLSFTMVLSLVTAGYIFFDFHGLLVCYCSCNVHLLPIKGKYCSLVLDFPLAHWYYLLSSPKWPVAKT